MSSLNYAQREVSFKIVYYGPALCGKTSNVMYVHDHTNPDNRGKMTSLKTAADRTLYFDFLPMTAGTLDGFKVRIHLYTVPGQVYHNATRKMVLKNVDGIVFVADSQDDKLAENIESLQNLQDNLKEYGYELDKLSYILQLNKRDLENILPQEELEAKLRIKDEQVILASAIEGTGIVETLKAIIKDVGERWKKNKKDNSEEKSQMV